MMTSQRYDNNKVSAKKVVWNGITFDSKMEFSMYKSLRKLNTEIEVHKNIIIYYLNGYSLTTNIDFYLPTLDQYYEVKGVYDDKYRRVLTEFLVLNPEILGKLTIAARKSTVILLNNSSIVRRCKKHGLKILTIHH